MANALPAPPALPVPPLATTFSALFNDASKDPFLTDGNHDQFLSSFNIDPAAPAGVHDSPEAVRQCIAAAANQHLPLALLLLVGGILRPYFLPFHRDQAMGAAPHQATDNKLFAYDGELVQGQGCLVEIPNQWFNLLQATTVGTTANIGAQLAVDNTLQMVGPYAAGDPDTVEVRTRSILAIPNNYVSLFLSQPEGVCPRYYFETILPVIEADGMAQTCMPLTHFCQVAITPAAGGGVSILQVIPPTAPVRYVPLLTQTTGLLHHLPALTTVGGGG